MQKDVISVRLAHETWVFIMNILANRPYAEVAPLLAEMDRQLDAAQNGQRESKPA